MTDLVEDKLHPRPQDETPSPEQLAKLGLMQQLKKQPPFKKNPGATILRRFRRGEVIFRQGEAGNSAFYVLTGDDLLRLREMQRQDSAMAKSVEREAELATLREAASTAQERSEPLQVATAHLFAGGERRGRPRGWLDGLRQWWLGTGEQAAGAVPEYLPHDGPSEIAYSTRQAPLVEGDVFGEMACLTQAPRSATVIASADCYMLEFLRNIFDHIHDDDGYRARMEAVYRERVLAGHLRRLDAFKQLTPEQIEFVQQRVELVFHEPGEVICDEGDAADCVYIIRKGMVQVLVDANVRLVPDDLADVPALGRMLLAGAEPPPAIPKLVATGPAEPAKSETVAVKPVADPLAGMAAKTKTVGTPLQRVWKGLSAEAQQAVRMVATSEAPSPATIAELVEALDKLARSRDFVAAEEFAALLERDEGLMPVRVFPGGAKGAKKNWSEMEVRIAGRLLLQTIFPQHVAKRPLSGPPRVINYLSQGEIFGEMGVLLPPHRRTATCTAFDHPPEDLRARPGTVRRDSSRVELVRIPAAVFSELMQQSSEFKRRVDDMIAARQARESRLKAQPAWEPTETVFASPEFQRLGLIQGQKLLLIDLDACTRCGDCVRACINTHDDGLSRLYLDGPRFDRFLIPSACRNCLDPACMIGCPVSSIQRGSDGQIEIRDWCIGCGKCAEQCPYDSIQMHDLGILPSRGALWRAAAEAPSGNAAGGNDWQQVRFDDRAWHAAMGPVVFDYDLARASGAASEAFDRAIRLRHEFTLAGTVSARRDYVCLSVSGECPGLEVWLNGKRLELTFEKSREKVQGELRALQRAEIYLNVQDLLSGRNVLAVRAAPPLAYGKLLLMVRIDEVPDGFQPLAKPDTTPDAAKSGTAKKPSEELKLYPDRAVVCDLCSSLPHQEPACVAMCPHEAAIRIDSRFEFPRLD